MFVFCGKSQRDRANLEGSHVTCGSLVSSKIRGRVTWQNLARYGWLTVILRALLYLNITMVFSYDMPFIIC